MQIDLEIFGDVQLRRKLTRFVNWAGNPLPVFRYLADQFLTGERKQFETEGRYASGGWVPITARWRERKIAKGFDPRILHMTHRLRDSLTMTTSPDAVRRLTQDSMFVGTRVPYTKFHQKPGPGARLPQRRAVELTERQRVAWVRTIQRYIVTGELEHGNLLK